MRDLLSKLDAIIGETALKDPSDLEAKRRALDDLEADPVASTDPTISSAIKQRRTDLEKEAKTKGMAEGQDSNTANLDAVFNEHDFYRLEHIWPSLEAGDKEEALRQINHYLRKGKNRAWWGDLQALDIEIDKNDVENSMVMWSKPIAKDVAEGVDEKDIINSGMPLKYIEQQLQQSGLEKDIRYFIRWAIDNGSSHIEDAIELGNKAQRQNPEISYGLQRLKQYLDQGVAEGDIDFDKIRRDAASSLKKDIDKSSDDRISKLRSGDDDEPFMQQVGRKIIGGVKGAVKGAAQGFAGKESIDEDIYQIGDDFGISFSEDFEIATEIIDILEDGIVIELDDYGYELLTNEGFTFEEVQIDEEKQKGVDGKACWKGYRRMGTKQKGGKTVDNCVKVGEDTDVDESGLQYYTGKKKYGKDGMAALAAAGRKGASEEELGRIKDKYKKEDTDIEEGKYPFAGAKVGQKEGPEGQVKGTDPTGYPKGKLVGGESIDQEVDEAKYRGKEVPLGKKLPGDVKKSKVYVRKPNGNIVKVNFGDKKMRIKKSNPKRRKSFRARHNCKNPGPRWKARYWSCRSW